MKMRTSLLFIILVTVSVCSHAQDNKANEDKIVKYFEWTNKIKHLKLPECSETILSENEKNRDTLFLQNFLKLNYDSVKLYTEFQYQPMDLIKYLYAIDFNGDHLLDVFYQGPTGAEGNVTQIFLNKGGNFKKVFAGYQCFMHMTFSKDRLISFRLYNPGCCADPQIVEYDYEVTYQKHEPIFSLNKTIGYLYYTETTENTFNPVRNFVINVDKSNLRHECYFFDDVEHPVYGCKGNITATYKNGAKGTAIGYKKEEQNEWIYVLMDPTTSIENCSFSTFMDQPTYIYGWILKKDTDLK